MSIDLSLLQILVCPETKKSVHIASPEVISDLNNKIASRTLRNRGGALLEFPISAALVRDDGKVAYPVIDDIPVMLIDESIALA